MDRVSSTADISVVRHSRSDALTVSEPQIPAVVSIEYRRIDALRVPSNGYTMLGGCRVGSHLVSVGSGQLATPVSKQGRERSTTATAFDLL